jgi:hypothetical protein
MNDASVSDCCKNGDSLSCCNQEAIEDEAFWEDFNSLLIQMSCLVERKKLHRTYTTSDLRKAGKRVLCNDGTT